MDIHDSIYQAVADIMVVSPVGTGGCLYWADAAIKCASQRGIKLVLQAGTMMWPRVRPEQDDGICHTHFSYVWEPNSPLTRSRLAAGLLPEMHVWAGNVGTNEIVDFTTGFLVAQCRKLIGKDWPGDQPPKYLWSRDLPEGVFYQPDRAATIVAYNYLQGDSLPSW